ncbi:MAG: O-antigen ligase family protein [Planctomycetota bacterium]|jgi:putative inorganic carbon (HCO3(-)) transporter
MSYLKTVPQRTLFFLDRWHWLFLTLAAPFLLFPSPASSPALLIVPGLWIVAWMVKREPLPRTPLNGVMLVFGLMILVSIYATYDLTISLPRFSVIVLSIGVFFATAREAQHPAGWWVALCVFLGVCLVFAGLGLLGTRWLTKFGLLAPLMSRLPLRLTSLSGSGRGFHPNQIAGTLLWGVPTLVNCSALLLLKMKRAGSAWGTGRATVVIALLVTVTLFVTGVFLLTQSRSAYIGLGFTGLVLISVILPSRGRWFFVGSLVVLAIAAIVVISQQGAYTALQRIVGSDLADDPALSLSTIPGRLELWSRAIYAIQDFPFTGMGMNTFRHVVHVLYPLFLTDPDFDVGHAHNEFLQAALDLGIPGLIAFLALHVGTFWMLIEVWQASKGPAPCADDQRRYLLPAKDPALIRAIVLGLGGGLFAHMIYGLTDAVALGARQGVTFWMVLGLISGLFSQTRSGRLAEWRAWPVMWISHRRSDKKAGETT